MKKMISIELERSFVNMKMLISLLIGGAISISQIYLYQKVGNVNAMYDTAVLYGKDTMQLPDYLWGAWLGGDAMLFNGFLFFLIIPLIAAFPYGSSYLQDEKNGYLKNVFTRTRKKNYFLAKWLATFCSGGVAIIMPLITNFLIMVTLYSSMGPHTESSTSMIVDASTLSNMFFSSPFLYIVIFYCIIFIYSGLYATFSLLVTFFTDYTFIILAFPFLIILFLSMILDLFGMSFLSPQEFLYPGQARTSVFVIFFEMFFLFIISFGGYLYYGIRSTN